ncbi:MAG: DUF3450 domain-containing protein, partial [Armatimonadetes bacterium]|nr:DUF3450 domain-containing protein [Armatimonadota bacterium]MDW8029540.1 hypothetical protein [Armatimonadota bacterium]
MNRVTVISELAKVLQVNESEAERILRAFAQVIGSVAAEVPPYFERYFEAQIQLVLQKIDDLERSTQQRFDEMNRATQQQINELRQSTQQQISDLKETMNQQISDLRQSTQQQISELRQSNQQHISAFRQEVERSLGGIDRRVDWIDRIVV